MKVALRGENDYDLRLEFLSKKVQVILCHCIFWERIN